MIAWRDGDEVAGSALLPVDRLEGLVDDDLDVALLLFPRPT